MVRHLPKLHEHVHDREKVAITEDVASPVVVDVLVVEETLAPGKIALHYVLDFFRQLLFHVPFHPSEQKWPQNRLQFLHHAQIERLVLIDALRKGITKPLLEVLLVREDLRHQKVHKRPQLHNVILQGRPS